MVPFNRNLAFGLTLLSVVLGWRLGIAAIETDNWRGFAYSLAQILLVASTAFIVLKQEN